MVYYSHKNHTSFEGVIPMQNDNKVLVTIFNRRELLCTYDLNLTSRVIHVLSENKIPYRIKTRFTGSMNRKTGSLKTIGEQVQHEVENKIFVHKKNFERAKHVIKICF